MPRPAPLSDTEQARIGELHAAGASRNDIAKDLGRSGDTITRYCRKHGLAFDRAGVAAATAAKAKDAAARRADAQLAELEILELGQTMVLKVLRGAGTFKTILKAPMGEEVTREIDFIPGDQLQRLANSRSSSTTIITNLARLDQDNGEHAAKSLLMGIAAGFGLTPPADD